MNCEDISRIADAGRFSNLTEVERRDAEAHALSCRHCAPAWAAHSHLAGLRIPPMPPELSPRCRALAALPMHSRGARTARRLTVVGCVVALAAAAAALTMYANRMPTPQTGTVAAPAPTSMEAASAPTSAPVVKESAAAAARQMTAIPAPPSQSAQAPFPLPLLPAPVHATASTANARAELALQQAAIHHPELVEGPETDGVFAVGVVLREDGSLLDSAVRFASNDAARDADAAIQRTMPMDGGSSAMTSRDKHSLLPDGRALRGNVMLRIATVPMNYDLSRSNMRVLQILGDRYADQLLPATDGQLNRLTVFLSDDGHVQREKIDRMSIGNNRSLRGGNQDDADFLAASIADRLGMDPAQIGLVGFTTLEEGSLVQVLDATGTPQPDDRRRMLLVYYAWPRRSTDNGPALGQGAVASGLSMPDLAAALVIVERLIPDVFTLKEPSAGSPTVVFTAKGEVIRAGRVKFKNGGGMDSILQEQLVPGVHTSSFWSPRLRNNAGETVEVTLAWEMPPDMAKAMKDAAANPAARAPAVGGE